MRHSPNICRVNQKTTLTNRPTGKPILNTKWPNSTWLLCRSQPVFIHSYHLQTFNLIFKIIATKIKRLKQSKVKIIGILEEIDSFYWPKMHFLKRCQKNGQGHPLFAGNRSLLRTCESFTASKSWHEPVLKRRLADSLDWWCWRTVVMVCQVSMMDLCGFR